MAIDTDLALVSLTDAKTFLKISGSTEDTIVGDIVNAASDYANRFCGRKFLSKEYTEYYDGDGTAELIVRRRPIVSVTSLHDDVNRDFDSTSAIDVSADVLLDKDGGILRLRNNEGAFDKGRGNVKIVYTAGYALASVPYGVQQAVKIMAAWLYKHTYQFQRHGIQSQSTATGRNQTNLPAEAPPIVRTLLKPHKNHGEAQYAFE